MKTIKTLFLAFVFTQLVFQFGVTQVFAAKTCECVKYEIQGTENGSCMKGKCENGEIRVCIEEKCTNSGEEESGGGGGTGGGGTAPVPTAAVACVPPVFANGSVVPSSLRSYEQVTVRCNYGKRLDCLSITSGGLTNCRYSRYEGTDNIFTCDAGASPGYYDAVSCVSKVGTTDNCCAATNKAGDLTIIGTDVQYGQDIVLPFGTYALSARVHSVISKGKGVRVSLVCNSDTCTTGKTKNMEIASVVFPESADFVSKTISVPLVGTGDDRHYLVKVGVDKGSEGYFDLISLKSATDREFVVNGDFANTVGGSIITKQPVAWGEGDNKIGYYYGSLAEEVQSTPSTGGGGGAGGTTPSGPTPTPGQATDMSLALKIKFQGITDKPKTNTPIQVQVKLAGTIGIQASGSAAVTPFTPITQSVSFTPNGNGVWTGKADLTKVPTGGGYKVYIKGPKHIQKKICANVPTEEKPGTYRCGEGQIVLAKGENTLNLSNIVLLAGDLPEVGGKQNGIVDAYDTTFIRTNLGSTDAAKASVGDLNLDGIIDTQDYSMVLQSLSIKYDEE